MTTATEQRRAPWEGLGHDVTECNGSVEILDKAKLNWTVELKRMTVPGDNDNNGSVLRGHSRPALSVPRAFAVVRPETATSEASVLGTVGDTYVPIQNRHTVDLLTALQKDHPEIHWVSAVALRGGADVVYIGRLEGMSFSAPADAGDITDPYIVAWTSHAGRRALSIFITSYRIWCSNQLRAASHDSPTRIRITHSGDIAAKVALASAALEHETVRWQRFTAWSAAIAHIPAQAEDIKTVAEAVHGAPRTRKGWEERREGKITQLTSNFGGERGSSLWHLLQATTEQVNHQQSYRPRQMTPDEGRMTALMQGQGHRTMWRAVSAIDRLALERGLAVTLGPEVRA